MIKNTQQTGITKELLQPNKAHLWKAQNKDRTDGERGWRLSSQPQS